MPLQKDEFNRMVSAAYQHLYDLVFLRSHPLTNILAPDAELSRKKKSWIVHDILLNVIDELDPGSHTPVFSREWRRHRLLVLRYSDGIAPKAVAEELSISLRHYYREHDAALEAIASILWDRYVVNRGAAPEGPRPVQPLHSDSLSGLELDTENKVSYAEDQADRLRLLRNEAAHLPQNDRSVLLSTVVPGIVELVQEMAKQKNIGVEVQLLPRPATIGMDRAILRQILVGVLAHLVEHCQRGPIRLCEQQCNDHVLLQLWAPGGPDQRGHSRQLAMLHELAAMQKAQIEPIEDIGESWGFRIVLPTAAPRTILLVDDNADALELFQRYLHHHHYHTVSTQSSLEALQLASKIKPYAIVLDLMLPEYDGWDVLQRLANHPETHQIPVVICTILGARHLALSLGAAAFLEKPVSEEELISALNTVALTR